VALNRLYALRFGRMRPVRNRELAKDTVGCGIGTAATRAGGSSPIGHIPAVLYRSDWRCLEERVSESVGQRPERCVGCEWDVAVSVDVRDRIPQGIQRPTLLRNPRSHVSSCELSPPVTGAKAEAFDPIGHRGEGKESTSGAGV